MPASNYAATVIQIWRKSAGHYILLTAFNRLVLFAALMEAALPALYLHGLSTGDFNAGVADEGAAANRAGLAAEDLVRMISDYGHMHPN